MPEYLANMEKEVLRLAKIAAEERARKREQIIEERRKMNALIREAMVKGMSISEIAYNTGIPESSVRGFFEMWEKRAKKKSK